MEAYFVRDKDPRGGVYDVFRQMPDEQLLEQRNTIQEVRHGDLPAEIFAGILMAEIKPDELNHFDEHYLPHFEQATVVWTREGGYVNGNE